MKKLVTLISALFAALALSAFAGCAVDDRPSAPEGIAQGYSVCYAFTAASDKDSVYDYMLALSEDGKLVFDGYDGGYGYYVTSVLGLAEATETVGNTYKGYSWSLYTTLTSVDGVIYSQDVATFIYGGITLYKASYGVSGLPCVEGESYALVYEYSEMSW